MQHVSAQGLLVLLPLCNFCFDAYLEFYCLTAWHIFLYGCFYSRQGQTELIIINSSIEIAENYVAI